MTRIVRLKRRDPERQDQIRLATWLTKNGIRFTASGNGGRRSPVEGLNLKRMGLSPGFPDLEIPLPSGSYHGLYIELKSESGGRLSNLQADWLNYLNDKGYCARVAKGFEEAKQIVVNYLALTPIAS